MYVFVCFNTLFYYISIHFLINFRTISFHETIPPNPINCSIIKVKMMPPNNFICIKNLETFRIKLKRFVCAVPVTEQIDRIEYLK